mgnify:CR=1 FL=1
MGDRLKAQLNKFKYPLLALVLGLIIMLLPIGGSSSQSVSSQTDEQRLAAVLLQRCDGVGNVTALLSETGAVIVCDGADDAAVRLSVIKAVEAFTGFSSDSIQVIKTAPNIGG